MRRIPGVLIKACYLLQENMEQQHVNSIYSIPVSWRGTKYMVEISSDSTLRDLGQKLLKLTEVKADTMRLIVPQISSKSSKMLHPFSDEDGYLDLEKISNFKVQFINLFYKADLI